MTLKTSYRYHRVAAIAGALALASACGTDRSPVAPTLPVVPANRSPSISSVTVSPASGVSEVTPFRLAAAGIDPDGDQMTYRWTIGAAELTGQSPSTTITGDGSVAVTLTVTDGRGGAAVATQSVTVGSMTGQWSFTAANCGAQRQDLPAVMVLRQAGTAVVGTIEYPGRWCGVPPGHLDKLDPGAPSGGGTIDAQGNFNARIKAPEYIDMYIVGKMDTTGRIVTGRVHDSGFGNSTDTFTMTKR